MNKLLGMQSFARVVECGSFTGAAKSLGLSVSAITKNVSRLEEDLGTQLLIRTTRRMTVTDFGREYYTTCRRVFADLESTENLLKDSRDTPSGRVTLLCPMFFGRVNLLPRLHELYARHPELEVEVQFGSRYEDVLNGGANLAVVVGQLEDSRYSARTLATGPIVCCATPGYLERHGIPQSIDDLLTHNCLVSRSALWHFSENGTAVELPVKGNLTVRDGDALREATLLGLGIAQSNWWLFRQDLAAGTLVEVLREYRVPGRPISVLYSPTRYMPRKVRVMIDFLVEITSAPEPS